MNRKLSWAGGVFGKGLGFGFAALWMGFWSLGTLAFDAGLVASVVKQVRALSFPTAEGVMLVSRVEAHSDSEGGTSYTPIVEYRYTIARQEHRGQRLQYHWSSFGSSLARQIVARFPAGSPVRVYYNPRDPADALLLPGLHAEHALIALFMTPFNIIMLGCWLAAWQFFTPTAGRLPWGASARRTPEGQVLRFYATPPIAAAGMGALGLSFAGVFLAAFGSALLPLGFLVGLVWIIVVGGSLWAFLRQRRRARLLLIDELRGIYSLRDVADRRPLRTGKLDELRAIAVREKSKRDSEGDLKQTYAVVLLQGKPRGPRRSRCLVAGWSEPQARQLAEWLAARLRVPLED